MYLFVCVCINIVCTLCHVMSRVGPPGLVITRDKVESRNISVKCYLVYVKLVVMLDGHCGPIPGLGLASKQVLEA